MDLQLENKLALITGSTAGIGFAIAKALAAEGARVIVSGRTEARVTGAIAAIRAAIPSATVEARARLVPGWRRNSSHKTFPRGGRSREQPGRL